MYPDGSSGVTLIQTGISLVFLTGDYVYKVKKPVNVGYLDYSTLEKRRFYCQREVELNRRLCPSAYLGVVPITGSNGRIEIAGSGEVIEYAVKMRYLPQERTLKVLLAGKRATADMLTRVAQKMADFHKKADTSPAISSYGSADMITANAEENFSEAAKYIGKTISQESYRKIKRYTHAFIETNAALLRKRVAEGRIRDCHGDLHAAHICFTDSICIYDCIEFNDRFRYCDVASEIAFLAMDLDNYGRLDLSKSFIDDYVSFSGDEELLKLLDFYKCYRAYVRGKVDSFDSDDPLITAEEREKALAAARKYFELAESYIR
ncbi:MAG: gluconokinase [Chloroflexi bacterium]|nr:gluconokinase [Chloroflexota bacterium]